MLQKITGYARRAIEDYDMIADGDKIAIALSGGKDSLTLLYVLHSLKQYYNKKFDIIAIVIHPGSDTFDTTYIKETCKKLNVECIIYDSHLSQIVFDIKKEKNPCSLCANLRRGMINSIAIENGCNKVALGHHLDDVIETLLMSMFLNGKIYTFAPVTSLSRSGITVIRPLIYVYEKDIRALSRKMDFKVIEKCCPADGNTQRQYMKNLIFELRKDIPKVRENLIGAIKRSDIEGWQKKED